VDNAEVVRRIFDAWNRRDPGWLALLAPDFEFVNPDDAVDPGTRTASGAEITERQGYWWTFRRGKAVRVQWFRDPRAALAAAGLG
jgi:ketosteroid isomerase-like protein